jgi:hypothetical protein
MFQTITRIPIAGTTILDEPLFIERQAKRGEHVVRNCKVFDKSEIVGTFLRIYCWNNCWQRSGLNYNNFLCRVNNKSRFDEWRLNCGWAEWRRRGSGGASRNEDKSQNNGEQLPAGGEAESFRIRAKSHNKKGRPSGSPQQGIYTSSSSAEPPPSDSTPRSSGRAISPLKAFCRISPSISFIRSGF